MNLYDIKPENYQTLLLEKKQNLKNLFNDFTTPDLEVYESKTLHYRMRAEFRVWHEGDDIYFYMFDTETKEKIKIESFPIATELINQVMKELLKEIQFDLTLRHKLFEVDFLSTESQEILVSMIYHKKLDENWEARARELKNILSEKFKINLIGRSKGKKIIIDEDFVVERLKVSGKEFIYKQIENSFTQPNAFVAVKMLEWAQSITKNAKGDLLELYCGNGNFSIALAENFRKVLATEMSNSSVKAAQYNIAVNGVDNLNILRMSAEEFSQAINGVREFFRLKDFDLKSYECETILVDPPRSGLDDLTLMMVSNYKNIVYISCNPETLCDNLKTLSKTHKITRFALFDQFPYTHHMECGVYLEKI